MTDKPTKGWTEFEARDRASFRNAPPNIVPGMTRTKRRRESRAAFDPVWGEWVVITSPEFEAVGETVERKTRRGLPISKCSRVEEKK